MILNITVIRILDRYNYIAKKISNLITEMNLFRLLFMLSRKIESCYASSINNERP